MDNLPEELIDNILNHLKKIDPISLYKIKFINKLFYKKINEIKDNYNKKYIIENISFQNNINTLCYKGGLSIFKWLFKNNIVLTENNIINLVSNNRLDVLKECIKYNTLLKIIFDNKYDIFVFSNNRLIKSESPLIIAGKHNHYEIIKLFLEIKIFNNPFHKHIDILLETLIQKNNKSIIKYLLVNHFNKIRNKNLIIDNCIKKINNIDDIIFYLILSKKIEINNSLIINCLEKSYNELCIYFYENCTYINIFEEHLIKIMQKNNIELFDYFFKKFPNSFISFKKLLKEIDISYEFFNHIFTNYLQFFNREFPIIELCLRYNYPYTTILSLVNNDYMITKESIKVSLENEDKKILKLLVDKY